jgi:hypothetical protein
MLLQWQPKILCSKNVNNILCQKLRKNQEKDQVRKVKQERKKRKQDPKVRVNQEQRRKKQNLREKQNFKLKQKEQYEEVPGQQNAKLVKA